MLLIIADAAPSLARSKTSRIEVRYVLPKNPAHQPIYDRLKQQRVLKRLQEFLSPFRLPRTLQVSLAGCDGEADAFYSDDAITICYEYIDELWKRMPAEKTATGIMPIDTIVGPFFDTSLHEFAHALFDMLDLPVLGREEDAADQVAAYIYLQLGSAEARRLTSSGVMEVKRTSAWIAPPPYSRFGGRVSQKLDRVCIGHADRLFDGPGRFVRSFWIQ